MSLTSSAPKTELATAWLSSWPQYTGATVVLRWPPSSTRPLGRPLAMQLSTLAGLSSSMGTLKVSNMIWVIFSRSALGASGGCAITTRCSSGATRSSL